MNHFSISGFNAFCSNQCEEKDLNTTTISKYSNRQPGEKVNASPFNIENFSFSLDPGIPKFPKTKFAINVWKTSEKH